MLDRTSVDSLTSQSNLAARLAVRDLKAVLDALPADDEQKRQVLLEAVPLIIDRYGAMAGVGAEEWYRVLRGSQVLGAFETVLGEAPDLEVVARNVRALIGPLFEKERVAEQALALVERKLAQLVERSVKEGARSTVLANALRDPKAQRFARVPAGAETCAFCHMLASRGWVYATAESAGKAKKTGGSFHPGCDCQIVPAFGSKPPHIEGYDPDLLYQRYLFGEKELKARFPGKKPTDEEVAALVRRLLPAIYTKGYRAEPGDVPFSQRKAISITQEFKHHVLVGRSGAGGHFHSSPRPRKTKFPPWWAENDIWEAAEDVFRFGKATTMPDGAIRYEGRSRGIFLRLIVRDGTAQTVFPLGGDGVKLIEKDGTQPSVSIPASSKEAPDVYSYRYR